MSRHPTSSTWGEWWKIWRTRLDTRSTKSISARPKILLTGCALSLRLRIRNKSNYSVTIWPTHCKSEGKARATHKEVRINIIIQVALFLFLSNHPSSHNFLFRFIREERFLPLNLIQAYTPSLHSLPFPHLPVFVTVKNE